MKGGLCHGEAANNQFAERGMFMRSVAVVDRTRSPHVFRRISKGRFTAAALSFLLAAAIPFQARASADSLWRGANDTIKVRVAGQNYDLLPDSSDAWIFADSILKAIAASKVIGIKQIQIEQSSGVWYSLTAVRVEKLYDSCWIQTVRAATTTSTGTARLLASPPTWNRDASNPAVVELRDTALITPRTGANIAGNDAASRIARTYRALNGKKFTIDANVDLHQGYQAEAFSYDLDLVDSFAIVTAEPLVPKKAWQNGDSLFLNLFDTTSSVWDFFLYRNTAQALFQTAAGFITQNQPFQLNTGARIYDDAGGSEQGKILAGSAQIFSNPVIMKPKGIYKGGARLSVRNGMVRWASGGNGNASGPAMYTAAGALARARCAAIVRGNESMIDIKHLPPGAYYLRINGPGPRDEGVFPFCNFGER
jgi:hypothetical protein